MVARRVIAYAQVGHDPATDRKRIRSAPRFDDFLEEYWSRWSPQWKASTLETHNGYRRQYLDRAWWLTLVPGATLFALVLSVNVFGDWLRDRLDPRSRSR
jgi:hypothetical protein